MTKPEFDRLLQYYGGQGQTGTPPGLWPHHPLTPREVPLWFRKLQPYPLARLLTALEELYTQDRRHAPSIQQVIEAMQSLAPPPVPVPAWQQEMARAQGITVRELFQAARPAHEADSAIASCFREIFENNLAQTGQEAGFIAACARFAADYPADRTFWLAQIATKRQDVPALDPDPGEARQQRTPRQVGSFTHLGALLPKGRDPHV